MPHVQSPQRLAADRSGLLIIDLQEKLCPHIPAAEDVVRQTHRLIEGSRLLGIPSTATVQYPRGLGPLVSSLDCEFPNAEEKVAFSAAVCRGSLDQWVSEGRDQIVVVGVESHVCVLQTVLDLLAEGLRPYVVADAVGSRHRQDYDVALMRMRDSGAVVVTTESVLFEWLGTADHRNFKAVSQIVKT